MSRARPTPSRPASRPPQSRRRLGLHAAALLLITPLGATARAQQAAATAPPTARAAAAPPREVVINRETYAYQGAGRRDPYASLMNSTDVRPLLSDLRLTGIGFDPDGRNSVAIMRDLHSKAQYRVRVGQQVGRLRVTAISPRSVDFAIEAFGYSRTETLLLSRDSSTTRAP
ncbi:MAG: hypothetical protein KJT01_07885 [Gemmatimonadetes bacterium]|nr:hypothetical protein [Gemmatimonadota bacterium]